MAETSFDAVAGSLNSKLTPDYSNPTEIFSKSGSGQSSDSSITVTKEGWHVIKAYYCALRINVSNTIVMGYDSSSRAISTGSLVYLYPGTYSTEYHGHENISSVKVYSL